MASIFSHALVGATLKDVVQPKERYKWTILVVVSTMVPDIDVLTFNLGVPYEDMWGHRGFSHSISFALVWAIAMILLFRPRKTFVAATVLFLSVLSHGLLDAMTNGGQGIAFLAPFDDTRYFAPWRPIQVSPIGVSAFFSKWGLKVIANELVWIGIPCMVIWVVVKFLTGKGPSDDHQ